MFIDTSAVVAILAGEPEAATFVACIEAAGRRETGPHVRLEATINLARILGLPVAAAGISVVSIDDAVARRAVDAFDSYGKGRGHPAQLNIRRLPVLRLRGAARCSDSLQRSGLPAYGPEGRIVGRPATARPD